MKKFLILSVAALMTLSAVPQAHALFGIGDVVFDPSNYAQNVLTAAHTLTQIQNQIQMLANEAQMLINEAKNLEHLNFSTLGRIRASIATIQRLFAQAQGIAFDLQRMQQQFDQLYPAAYGPDVTVDQMSADAHVRWQRARDAVDTAMQLQSQAKANFDDDEAVLSDLVNQSQSVDGIVQAVQATNQLLALQARQQIQAQQLQITQGRAADLEQARWGAEQERARELARRFMTRGTPYTPAAVNGF